MQKNPLLEFVELVEKRAPDEDDASAAETSETLAHEVDPEIV